MAKKVEKKIRNLSKVKNKPGYQVFVSHATDDKWIAKVICEKLEEIGASTFRDDRDINGGDDIPEKIRQQIKRSQEMVVLMTPKSFDRKWVLFEVGAAWGWRKNFRIVAIRYHVENSPIPEMIKSKKTININEIDNYLSEISTRVTESKNGKKK